MYKSVQLKHFLAQIVEDEIYSAYFDVIEKRVLCFKKMNPNWSAL